MEDEIHAIEKNKTWESTTLPRGQSAIGVKNKVHDRWKVDCYNARLVAKGYKQEYRIDYKEVFAPVSRLDTVRMLISLAASHN